MDFEDVKTFVRENFDWLLEMVDTAEERADVAASISEWINTKIDIPYVPEVVEGKFIRMALGAFIDQVVDAFLEEKAARKKG